MALLGLGIGYLIGNFQTAVIIGKLFSKIDIRNHGSGNAGTTNVIRVLGWKAGVATFLGDFFKAFIAVILCGRLIGDHTAAYAALGAVLGHNWPVFLGFRGGKGIASTVGALAAIQFSIALLFSGILLGVIIITRYVSLGSIIAAISLPFLFAWIKPSYDTIALGIVLCILALYKHKDNIKRLIKKQEKKIGEKTSTKY